MSIQNTQDLALNFVVSAIATTVVAPLDRIKLLLQVQPNLCKHNSSLQNFHYTGVRDCFLEIRTRQGLMSLWRGNLPSVLRIVPG